MQPPRRVSETDACLIGGPLPPTTTTSSDACCRTSCCCFRSWRIGILFPLLFVRALFPTVCGGRSSGSIAEDMCDILRLTTVPFVICWNVTRVVFCCCCQRHAIPSDWSIGTAVAVELLRTTFMFGPHGVLMNQLLGDVICVPTWLLPMLGVSGSAVVNRRLPCAAEWIHPNCNDTRATTERVVLYFHGGSFNLMSPGTHRPLLAALALEANASILAVDYRRPPDFPFPTPANDCRAYLRWLVAEERVEPSQIVLAGDSAGGALVIEVLAQLVAEERESRTSSSSSSISSGSRGGMVAGAILISPWVDVEDYTSPSWAANGSTDYLGVELLEMYARLYAGEAPLGAVSPRRHLDAASIGDATSSSLEAAAAATFPPLQIEVGGREVFRDAVESFAQGARSAGCADVRLNVGSDHAHVYQLYASRSASAIDSMRRMGRFIVEQTSSAGSSAPQYGSAVPVAQKSHDE